MRNYTVKDVDEYIENAAEESRPTLNDLRRLIKSTMPEADEKISWGVPFYRYHGLLGGYSVFKKHVSFGLAFVLSEQDREDLESQGYKTGSKTVQIRFDQPIPVKIIEKIIRTKAKMNEKQDNAKIKAERD